MQIDAPWLTDDASQAVCRMLTDAGHQVYFVGGCVRNALLGAPVSDLDVSTDARPEDVLTLADAAGLKAIPTGIDHGTVTVVADGKPFEITTFRRDVETDGRRAVVAFSTDMADDARRRDFTMNALYAAPDGTVLDPVGQGLDDLAARKVRFIDDADMRIKEDYLRILRFFRFHAWYGNTDAGIDAEALAACADNVEGIVTLSRERIGQEMVKLLSAPDPAPALASFAACGGLMQALPGAGAGALAPLVHLEQAIELAPDPMLRLAAIGGQDAADALRLSKAQTRQLAIYQDFTPPQVTAYRHGAQIGRGMLALQNAVAGQEIAPDAVVAVEAAAGQVMPVTAQDFMPKLQGAALGAALADAEDRWIASGFTLTKDQLIG
ncbi:CCA tRNA nucleotidyltransferase [Yoonia sp. 208BN28-4]|uniref:CCA tRNA nucleotidyltransferase n=1 Tax=Yoonia sp. 208BN28-4 TaxID=3126505 RepID=UPI0030AB3064